MITDAGVNRECMTAGVGIAIWTADTDELVATVQMARRAENEKQLSSSFWELVAIER